MCKPGSSVATSKVCVRVRVHTSKVCVRVRVRASVCVPTLTLDAWGFGGHGQITSRTLAAEGERWAGAGNHPVVPHPESLAAQATYTESLLPGSGYGQNTFQALGSSPGLLQSPIL